MDFTSLISELDTEITRLQTIRAALAGSVATPVAKRGRPKGSGNKPAVKTVPAKRTMSAAGRARVAAAQKLRWAQKKAIQAVPAAPQPSVKKAKKAAPLNKSKKSVGSPK